MSVINITVEEIGQGFNRARIFSSTEVVDIIECDDSILLGRLVERAVDDFGRSPELTVNGRLIECLSIAEAIEASC